MKLGRRTKFKRKFTMDGIISVPFTIRSHFTTGKLMPKTATVVIAVLVSCPAALYIWKKLTSKKIIDSVDQPDQTIESKTEKRFNPSSYDYRRYRDITLKNGLKIRLISDPDTEKATACMTVDVGSMSDSRDFPGLAHLCEHTLSQGNEKYPQETEYDAFLAAHGGTGRAYTRNDKTGYNFTVAPEYMQKAFDRFAHMFICPLFSHDTVQGEVKVVNSEHRKNLMNDKQRLAELFSSISKPDHDYKKFSTGNLDTLWTDPRKRGIDIREELVNFFQKYYSSNLMSLCVLGKESLDDLATLVIPLMEKIENKNVQVPRWPDHPYGPDQIGHRYNIVPIKDTDRLFLLFPIPDLDQYRSKPGRYIYRMMRNKGAGGLLCELRKRGWVNKLEPFDITSAKDIAFFKMIFKLTRNGLEHVDDILHLVFSYLNMLASQNETSDDSYPSYQDLHYPDPFQEVTNMIDCMADYPAYLLLKHLSPRNMSVFVVSKSFQGQTDLIEPWYGVQYSKQPIEESFLKRLEHPDAVELFHLPHKNPFITTKFDLFDLEKPDTQESIDSPPELLTNDQSSRIWYKQDHIFRRSKCSVYLHLKNPIVNIDITHSTLAWIYIDLVIDSLIEYSGDADFEGYTYTLTKSQQGIILCTNAYSEKQEEFLKKILGEMRSLKIDQKRFEIMKEKYIRQFNNYLVMSPLAEASDHFWMIMACGWKIQDVHRVAENVTIHQVEQFATEFLSNISMEALIHGNTTKENASHLTDLIKEILTGNDQYQLVLKSDSVPNQRTTLLDGDYYIYETVNLTHPDSVTSLYLQVGSDDRQKMLAELLAQILRELFFSQMRSKEHLCYIAETSIKEASNFAFLAFSVQSDAHPKFVENRIEVFLHHSHTELLKMEPEIFEKHKNALIGMRQAKPTELEKVAQKYWEEILDGNCRFDRGESEISDLKKITKEDLIEFYENQIALHAPKRKKLTILVYSNESKAAESSLDSSKTIENSLNELIDAIGTQKSLPQGILIEDIDSFKKNHSLD